MSSTYSSPPPLLYHRPEAKGFKVEQLLQEANIGRLRIPAFQRPLRWKSQNVVNLFDSIRRGFPVGNLLMSRAPADAMTVSFGPVAIAAPAQHAALWVVDGQQRVTALVATLLRSDAVPQRDYWAIWYDLEKQRFEMLTKKEADVAWIPLNALSDSVKQLKWIRAWSYAEEREDLVNRALDLGKAIREYEIPAYIVEGVDQKTLRLIFTRVNTGGVGMRESEIFEALYGQEGDKPIRSAVARLFDLGFGALDEDLFLRCIRATCTPMLKDAVKSDDELPENAIHRTEAALRRAIKTIKTWAGIPIFKLMPYRLPLYILSTFYDQFPDCGSKVDRLIATWIWRGALSGDHENSSQARVRELVKVVRTSVSPDIAIVELIHSLGDFSELAELPNHPINKLDVPISLKSAASKIFVLGMISASPQRIATENSQIELFENLDDDSTVDERQDDANEIESLDSQIYMSIVGDQKFGTDIVIRLNSMKPKVSFDADTYDLDSFLLDEIAILKLGNGDVDGFRTCRREILRKFLTRFVSNKVGEQFEIRPSINAILTASITEMAIEGENR